MNSPHPSSSVRGVKKVVRPSVHATSTSDPLVFHTSFEDVECSASAVQTGTNEWALHDTRATHHVFKNRKYFKNESFKENESSSKRLKLAGGDVSLVVKGQRTVVLKAGDGTNFELLNCLWVPDLARNLVAGGILKSKGVRELYDPSDPSNFSLVKGSLALFNGYVGKDHLMHLELKPVSPRVSITSPVATNVTSSLVHRQLGHVSDQYLSQMCRNGSVEGLGADVAVEKCICVTCLKSKGRKLPHNHTRPRAKRFLENIHVDLSGIIRTKGLKNENYYILFTDDYSLYRHIYPLVSKTKEEVLAVFRTYIAVAERQTGCSVKTFTLDRGGEFINNLMMEEVRELGIEFHLTAGHTPAQNGVAERSNRTIGSKARAMMLESGLPLRFWYQACSAAVFIANRTVTKAVSDYRTLFELWHF